MVKSEQAFHSSKEELVRCRQGMRRPDKDGWGRLRKGRRDEGTKGRVLGLGENASRETTS